MGVYCYYFFYIIYETLLPNWMAFSAVWPILFLSISFHMYRLNMYSNILVNLLFSFFFSEDIDLFCYSNPCSIQRIIILYNIYCTLILFFSHWNYTRSNFWFTPINNTLLKKCYFPAITVFHISKRQFTITHSNIFYSIRNQFFMTITDYLVAVWLQDYYITKLLIRGRQKNITRRDKCE